MTDKKKREFDYKKYKKILKDLSKNYWAVSTVVLAILLIATLIMGGIGESSEVSANVVRENILSFIENQGGEIELGEISNEGSFYQVTIAGGGGSIFVTKDGKFVIQPQVQLTGQVTTEAPRQTAPASANVVKSDKPVVELFIMSHCPYGTQAEKGFIPLLESFDKADAQIRFVHYFMHEPEETETPRQVCIREEQANKFLPYLREFLKEGNSANAIAAANIDETKMNTCISSEKWEEYYNMDKALSESYGVQGSPTLVINGVIAQAGRDSASYLSAVCSAFNDAPEECGTLTLSSTAPSPMWGWDATGASTSAQC
ncbi:MAG: thioredoxin domain-containing protein [archaeon]